MRIHRFLVLWTLCLVSFALNAPAHAQGLFIDEGFGFSTYMGTTDDVTTFGTTLGYASEGQSEISVSLGRAMFHDADLHGVHAAFHVGIYPFHEATDRFPLRFSASLDYNWVGDPLEVGNIHTQTWGLAATLFGRDEPAGSLTALVPMLEFGYVQAYGAQSGQGVGDGLFYSTAGAGLRFAVSGTKTRYALLMPTITLAEGGPAFNIALGLLLP